MFNNVDAILKEHQLAMSIFTKAKLKLEGVKSKVLEKKASNTEMVAKLVNENGTLEVTEVQINKQIEKIDSILG